MEENTRQKQIKVIARLTGDSYCSLLDELFKFYLYIGDIHPTEKRSIYRARKYLECTRYSFDEIKARTRVKLRVSDFEFEGRLTYREKITFVKYFETFIEHIVLVIRYIHGGVKSI